MGGKRFAMGVAVLAVSLFTAGAGSAAIIRVCLSGCAYSTIQAGIDAAVGGDIVLVGDGTYRENIDFRGKEITVQSENGAAAAVIDGGGLGRAVTMVGTGSPGPLLSGFTVTGGKAELGAGVYLSGGRVRHCVVTGNRAEGNEPKGGGIFCGGGSVSSSLISGNSAVSGNPDIYASFAEGGGVYASGCPVDHSAVSGNTLTAYYANGAGIWTFDPVESCAVTGNTAYGHWYALGGGIYSTAGSVRNSLISGNDAHTDREPFGTNTAWGGGVHFFGGGELESCTVSGNSIDGDIAQGGGVYFGAIIRNSIIWGNSAAGDVMQEGPQYFLNLFAPAVFEHTCAAPLPEGAGNIGSDPLLAADSTLGAGSPCVDAGLNQAWMEGAADLAGNDRVAQGVVDMGAYEYGAAAHLPPPEMADDFSDGDAVGDPEWAEVRGSWRVTVPLWRGNEVFASSRKTAALALARGLYLNGTRIEAKFKIGGTLARRSVSFIFDYRSPSSYRYVQVKQLPNGSWKMLLRQKGTFGGDDAGTKASAPLAGFRSGNLHDIRIDVRADGAVGIWLDGVQKINGAFAGPSGGGQAGLRSDLTALYVDDFTLYGAEALP